MILTSLERYLDRPRAATRVLVSLPVAFNLWLLRGELVVVQNLNDSVVHLQMIRWAQAQIERGRIPLDGWYPYLGLGSAHFHHYQVLPHILTAYLGQIFGTDMAFRWTLYILLALWPLCVFWTARLFEIGTRAAVVAAMVSPLLVSTPGYGYEHGSYTWQGYGVWAQLWGMWLLPLTWALTWRAVGRNGSVPRAALALAATIACHFLTGYLALFAVVLWPFLRPGELLARGKRALVTIAGGVLIASWVIVPTAVDGKWINSNAFQRGTYFNDSFGAEKVLGWLFTGQMYDRGRFGVVTLLVGAGLVRCWKRRENESLRALGSLWVLSMLLFFGRSTIGPLLHLMPFSDDLLLHRFIIGVHMSGILLAGVGAVWIGGELWSRAEALRMKPGLTYAAAAFGCIVFLAPAWLERISDDLRGNVLIEQQKKQDETDGADLAALIDRAKAAGDGRIYGGMRSNWGTQYSIGEVPVFAVLGNRDADAVGFTLRTASLSSDVEAWFDETKMSHYELFNVRYILLPQGREPGVPAELIEERGRHVLWRVATTGYVSVVDTASRIAADRTNLAEKVRPFLQSGFPERKLHPLLAFAGHPAPSGTLDPEDLNAKGDPGRTEAERNKAVQGVYSAQVEANRPAFAMLKASFDPRWEVFVDGQLSSHEMIAPSFVGVLLGTGSHRVQFRYVPYPHYPLLFLIGLVTLGGLFAAERSPTFLRGAAGPENRPDEQAN